MTEINEHENTGGKSLPVPLHRRIAELLTQQVTSGQLKPGQKLPSERKIASQFTASRATVRTALQHLEQAGLITRRDRRSAIVALRRDITPHLSLACGSNRVIGVFRKLSDMHLLPPRCQLQRLDLQYPDMIAQLLSQPAGSADILLCDLEFVRALRGNKTLFSPVPARILKNGEIPEPLLAQLNADDNYNVVPLSISPMVLYYNKAIFRQGGADIPAGSWHWDQLLHLAQSFVKTGQYGFQLRPSFGHISSLMNRWGGQLYQEDGKVAAASNPTFEATIRFLYDLLHNAKAAPVLAKAEQINLFAERRCAMAMDDFGLYSTYHKALGDDLGVARLPGAENGRNITNGIAALVLAGKEDTQPIEDILRSLLNANNQQILSLVGAGCPVRSDLQYRDSLSAVEISADVTDIFLGEMQNRQVAHLPATLEHKLAVENLFLELWLGLDNIDSICNRFRDL